MTLMIFVKISRILFKVLNCEGIINGMDFFFAYNRQN
jgi:hypothetical protein